MSRSTCVVLPPPQENFYHAFFLNGFELFSPDNLCYVFKKLYLFSLCIKNFKELNLLTYIRWEKQWQREIHLTKSK